MPSNVGPALGIVAQTFANRLEQKHTEERDDELNRFKLVSSMVEAGVSSGRIADPNQAFSFLLENAPGKSGKAGKGGKNGGLPGPIQTLLGAIKKAGGQGQPTGGAPKFLSNEEMNQQADVTQRHTQDVAREGKTEDEKAKYQEQIRQANELRQAHPEMTLRDALAAVGFKVPTTATRTTPGSTPGSAIPANTKDSEGQPIDPKGYYKRVEENDGTIAWVPTSAPAGQQVKPGTFGDYLKTRETEVGHKLGTKEIGDALREWNRDNLKQTPEEKERVAKELATYRASIGLPQTGTVLDEARSIRLGSGDVQYINLGGYTGEKSKNKAREDAEKAGIATVGQKEADQLESANTALGSLNEFYQTLKDKMPADAAGRPLAQVEIPLKQFFQTDEDLAAAVAWNITVLPQLRAMSITGRVPVFEYQQALNAQPKLTDTVGVAAKKMDIVRGVLERGARSILDRPNQKPKPDAATPAVPKGLDGFLKDKPAGEYKVNGQWYRKDASGLTAIAAPSK